MRRAVSSFLLCAILSTNAQAGPKAKSAQGSSIQSSGEARFSAGDEAFRKRRDETQGREALKLFREYFAKNPTDSAAAWRVAMGCYFVGIRLTKDKDARKELYAEGRDAGFAGVKLDEKCAACHFWGAINMALYGDAVGPLKLLFQLGELKEHLNKVIELEPGYAFGGAYRLLGLIDQKLPGLFGGDNDRAREYFEKAIAIAPDEPLNYLFLARLLRDDLDKPTEAMELARRGLQVKPPGSDRLEALDALEDLKAFKIDD